jgi:hypothetical protein
MKPWSWWKFKRNFGLKWTDVPFYFHLLLLLTSTPKFWKKCHFICTKPWYQIAKFLKNKKIFTISRTQIWKAQALIFFLIMHSPFMDRPHRIWFDQYLVLSTKILNSNKVRKFWTYTFCRKGQKNYLADVFAWLAY